MVKAEEAKEGREGSRMYTLANGKRVKELQIELEKEGCKITQAYWLHGRLVRDCFNEETDEYATIDEYETPKD
jgi:hypothetical protein